VKQGKGNEKDIWDDIGIPVEMKRFRALAAEYLARMESGVELSTEDYVTMARLWNTILFRHLDQDNELFRRYNTAFFPHYIERIANSLDAMVSKGMSYYSKTYDLYIGGKPHPNSIYRLKPEEEVE
jgi:hypothetical protein